MSPGSNELIAGNARRTGAARQSAIKPAVGGELYYKSPGPPIAVTKKLWRQETAASGRFERQKCGKAESRYRVRNFNDSAKLVQLVAISAKTDKFTAVGN
jgi:hypothetical protein